MIGSCNSDYRCPITANCPIAPSNYNFAGELEQNTAVYASITFGEIVIVVITTIIHHHHHHHVLFPLREIGPYFYY